MAEYTWKRRNPTSDKERVTEKSRDRDFRGDNWWPVTTQDKIEKSSSDRYAPLRSLQDSSETSQAKRQEQFYVKDQAEKPLAPQSTQKTFGKNSQGSSWGQVNTQGKINGSSSVRYAPWTSFQDSSKTLHAEGRKQVSDRSRAEKPLAQESNQETFGGNFTASPPRKKEGNNSTATYFASGFKYTPGGLSKASKTLQIGKTPVAVKGESVLIKDKAIPLCLPDNLQWNPRTGEIQKRKRTRRDLYVVEEAFAELQKIKDPVCVVAIVGPCRDGKSFILSETFGQADVFPVGYKTDPETMGIWMWILPYKMQDKHGRKYRVVLLDSEGIDAAQAKRHSDNQIYTLTVLLASVLIYNSKNVPKRSDLDGLNFVVRLSQKVKVTSKMGSHNNEDIFHKTFPHFIWLLRDVVNDLPSDCKNIKDFFLRRIFRPDSSQTNHTHDKIAQGILHYFSGFDAFCLPIPTYVNELLQDFRRNKYDKRMNPEFLTGIEQFKELLTLNMGPKKSCNDREYVTGEGLTNLTRFYVHALNDPDNIPDVKTAWETHVQAKCKEAKTKALIAYDKNMKDNLLKLPCETEKILESHESAASTSMAIFEAETAGITSDNTRSDCKELMKETVKKLSEWKTKNDIKTKKDCEQLLKKLKQDYLDPMLRRLRGPTGTSVTCWDIDTACSNIEREYKRRAVGAKDVRADVFTEFHASLDVEMRQYKGVIKNLKKYEEDVLKQRRENAQKERESERLRREAQYQKKQLEIQEKKLKRLEIEKQTELQDKIRECKTTEDILIKKIRDMEAAGMERQIDTLKDRLNEANDEKRMRQNEIRNLRIEIGQIREELRRANRPWYKKLFGLD